MSKTVESERLLKIREGLGISTTKEFAEFLGVNSQSLNHAFTGGRKPSKKIVAALFTVANVSGKFWHNGEEPIFLIQGGNNNNDSELSDHEKERKLKMLSDRNKVLIETNQMLSKINQDLNKKLSDLLSQLYNVLIFF